MNYRNTILCGDVIEQLAALPDGCVQCCVTSPPYWGLRDYGQPGQLGLEKTPEEYVAKMVQVFREVRRVLRDDGTCWLNLGDSYAASGPRANNNGSGSSGLNSNPAKDVPMKNISVSLDHGLKPKDLCGIPWRVAFALQADGWWLRQDIIWAKPNPMPESVTDRCTKAHEYLFLLTKAARYYYDAEAVKEEGSGVSGGACFGKQSQDATGTGAQQRRYERPDYGTRNRRSVWTVPTQPYSEAHFATFPPKLIEPCIKAGTSEKGCCPECGKPWVRIVNRTASTSERHERLDCPQSHHAGQVPHRVGGFDDATAVTAGWQPGCECEPTGQTPAIESARAADGVALKPWAAPCIVLDPFMGSGTTGMVAAQLGRDYIGTELNPEYIQLAQDRIGKALAPETYTVADVPSDSPLLAALKERQT